MTEGQVMVAIERLFDRAEKARLRALQKANDAALDLLPELPPDARERVCTWVEQRYGGLNPRKEG